MNLYEFSVRQEFHVKSVDVIPGRIDNLAAISGAHIEFKVKPHVNRFSLISISAKKIHS